MAKIIVLNAPPGAGKDTIGWLVKYNASIQTRILTFKRQMFNIAYSILGGRGFVEFSEAYNDRARKEEPQDVLNGMSCREFMIWLSEDVIKPKFGKGYFGKMLSDEAGTDNTPVICTDGGFEEEIVELLAGWHDVRVCRLHRQGCTFEGDSRDYLRIDRLKYIDNYSEHDYVLVDGEPMITVNQIIRDHLAK